MSNLALPAALATKLDDKYTATTGRVFLTGTQALIRLPMLQRERAIALPPAKMADGDLLPTYRAVEIRDSRFGSQVE